MKPKRHEVFRYPQTMGAYNALNENIDYINVETLSLAIEYSKERGDDALIREDVERAIETVKARSE